MIKSYTLTEMRKHFKLTRVAAAKQAGINRVTWQLAESGERGLSVEAAIAIAKAFEVVPTIDPTIGKWSFYLLSDWNALNAPTLEQKETDWEQYPDADESHIP